MDCDNCNIGDIRGQTMTCDMCKVKQIFLEYFLQTKIGKLADALSEWILKKL